ncbi:MAG: hypothetical protein QOF40_3230 [Actinomycetota bacterium]|jgi:hypothetical protein|nr:hypothetical protein [Actinomycetota bacterium]
MQVPQPNCGAGDKRLVSMDIEEFYDGDPRRQASEEIEFGREWYENDGRYEVAWVADTGEVYAMAEPYNRRGVTTQSVTVEVLAVIEGREAINSVLTGWQAAMTQPDSLAWVRARIAGEADSRT